MRQARSILSVAPVVASAVLLLGVLVDKRLFHTPPADAAPYHERVAAAGPTVPYNVGPWVGVDVPMPAGAVSLLKPNLMIARRFERIGLPGSATFVLVQCRDARDLIGHYPLVCYGNQGWSLVRETRRDETIGDTAVHATQYQFTSARFGRAGDIVVDNFMLLPDGEIAADMDGIHRTARDTRSKFFGAAQVQLVSDAALDDVDRAALFREFVTAVRPLMLEIGSGVSQ